MPQETIVTIISDMGDRPSAHDAALVVIYGHDVGRKLDLNQARMLIGRSSKADIQIEQESVGRAHAEISRDEMVVMIRDLDSTNGTYVNDELIRQRELRDGDLIKIGRTILKFLSGASIEHAYHEEIYRLTTTDGLTNIYNKRFFLDAIERELPRAIRYQRPLALVMFGIDHFKAINDTYGHHAGDAVLKQTASLVRGRLRREDVFARVEGSVFAILLPEVDIVTGRTIAEKIRMTVERGCFGFEVFNIPVTISVGVAAAELTDDPSRLIQRAEARRAEALNAGRNCCRG